MRYPGPQNDLVGKTGKMIIFSKGRCLMDKTSTRVVSHVSIRKDLKVVSRLGCVREKVKERLVHLSHQVCYHQGRLGLIRFGSHGRLPLLLVIHNGIELREIPFQRIPCFRMGNASAHRAYFQIQTSSQKLHPHASALRQASSSTGSSPHPPLLCADPSHALPTALRDDPRF